MITPAKLYGFVNKYNHDPGQYEQYKSEYKDLFEKHEAGEPINRERAEMLQEVLCRNGDRFAQYNRINDDL
jgi:hypothetical protein